MKRILLDYNEQTEDGRLVALLEDVRAVSLGERVSTTDEDGNAVEAVLDSISEGQRVASFRPDWATWSDHPAGIEVTVEYNFVHIGAMRIDSPGPIRMMAFSASQFRGIRTAKPRAPIPQAS